MSAMPISPARAAAAWITAGVVLLALAACGTVGIVAGPPDLDTTSPAAPVCEVQTYPPRSQFNGNRGNALVRAQVRADGSIASVALQRSTNYDELDAASLAAVRRCRFAPAPTAAAAMSDALRPVVVTVVWDLVGMPSMMDRPVVKIGVQPSAQ